MTSKSISGVGRLEGKVAIVSGAAGGIGRAIAIRFAAEGAVIIAADVKQVEVEETERLIVEAGGRAVTIIADVSNASDAAAMTERAKASFGRLDILVNNAATFIEDGTVADIPEADWKRSLDVNLTGAFLVSKHAVPLMAAGGGGSIIHMASQLGQVGKKHRSWYGVAKAGLIQLAKVMAIDHADHNIRVNSLSPGPIATDRVRSRYGSPEKAAEQLSNLTLLRRLGSEEEIASAALFLASDEASFMTGADLLVDGGYNAI
jgi:NAD(P)-dependent dehydrogenase (short-subunit alcohol dehydrogenase family)